MIWTLHSILDELQAIKPKRRYFKDEMAAAINHAYACETFENTVFVMSQGPSGRWAITPYFEGSAPE